MKLHSEGLCDKNYIVRNFVIKLHNEEYCDKLHNEEYCDKNYIVRNFVMKLHSEELCDETA